MKRSLLLWILFIAVLTAPLLHAAKTEDPPDRGSALQEILILNSYHPGYAWSDDEQAGVIDVFREKDKNWLPVIEYLDLKRLPDGKHLAEFKNLLSLKYQKKKFSVVIAMDNVALVFAMDNQAKLFRNAPIVFCGINNYTPSLLKGCSDVTGIVEAIDIAGTIEAMLRLHPAAREIFVPHDYTMTGLAVRKEIEKLVPRFGARVRFRFTDPLTMEELLKKIERLPKDSLILEIGFLTDKSYRTFGVTETTRLFYEHSPVPIYSTYEQRLGFGIVGGKLLSARIHGANAARIALRVLAGEKASAIPVVFESDSQLMFDYTIMKRFGIPLSALPEGSTVINQPVSFYAAHRVVIQTALGVIVFLALVIFLLAINVTHRRRSAVALRASEAKYYDLYENAPDMHFSVDVKTATITECNKTLVDAFGYSKEEILGLSIFEIDHPDGREESKRVFQQFMATGEVHNAERMIRRKDGEIIYVSLNASAVRDKEGKIILSRSVWRDITERKRAEIRLARLNDCFLQFGVSPEDNINRLVAVCGELMNATCALYNRLGKNLLCSVGQWQAPAGFKSEDKPNGHICYDLIQQGGEHPLLVRNLQESPYAGTDPNILPYGLQTYLGMVVKWKQTAVGSLCVVYQTDIIPSNNDLQFMTIIASAIGIEEDRLRAEEALRLSEENFHRSLDNSPLGVRIAKEEGETVYANRAILDIYGYDSLEELITTPVKNRYTPGSCAEFQIRREKRKRGDDIPSEYDISIIRKDGEIRNLHVFRKEVLWNGERQFQVIYQDITERKRSEDALRKSQEKLIEAHRLAHIGVWNWVTKTDTVLWTEELYRIAGLDPMLPAPTYAEHSNIYAPESWDLLKEAVERAMKTGKPYNIELKLIRPDGTTRWVNAFGGATYDNHGRIEGLQGTVQDITERKRSEEALHHQNEMLQTILDSIPVMVAFFDHEGHYHLVNRCWQSTLGWSLEKAQNNDVLAEIYPDPAYRKYVVDCIAAAAGIWSDFKTRTRDGRVLDTSWVNVPLSDGSNIGIGIDITERKQAEEEKRRMEERSSKVVEDIFRFIPEGVLVFSRKMELLRQNQAFRELVSGYAKRLGFAGDELENLIVDKIKAAMGDKNIKEIRISRKHETGEQT